MSYHEGQYKKCQANNSFENVYITEKEKGAILGYEDQRALLW